MLHRSSFTLTALCLAACDGRSLAILDADVGNPSSESTAPVNDSGLDEGRPVVSDLGSPFADLDQCGCKPGDVWLQGRCVATNRLGCGPGCNPGGCPSTHKCESCAASPSCSSKTCAGACIPVQSQVFQPGVLRVSPTSGLAGKPVKLRVEGGQFFLGALWWVLRMGSAKNSDIDPLWHSCSLDATVTPPTPGLYAVEVSYGGKGWALAGFYLATGGSTPPPPYPVQPGYPCTPTGAKCAEAPPYKCSCVSGRCACPGP